MEANESQINPSKTDEITKKNSSKDQDWSQNSQMIREELSTDKDLNEIK